MARLARVAAGVPHHVTRRGNWRQATFFNDDDTAATLELLADGLAAALGEARRRTTRPLNFREGWRGHLWWGRFASLPLDGDHVVAAARTVELNPVRAGLTARPEDWRWSSARAHPAGRDAGRMPVRPLLDKLGDWRAFLAAGLGEEAGNAAPPRAERTAARLGGVRRAAGSGARACAQDTQAAAAARRGVIATAPPARCSAPPSRN